MGRGPRHLPLRAPGLVRYEQDDPTSFAVRQGWPVRLYAYVVLAGVALTFLTLVLPLVLGAFF